MQEFTRNIELFFLLKRLSSDKKLERISVKLKEYMDRLDREDKSEDTIDEDDKEDYTPLSDKIHQLQEQQQLAFTAATTSKPPLISSPIF